MLSILLQGAGKGSSQKLFRKDAALAVAVMLAPAAFAQDYTLTVRTIAELQAINTSALGATNAVVVQGYYVAGDRGGGLFEWKAGSSSTPDGGRFLCSSNGLSAAGRWERMLNGEAANVKMWGAHGSIDGGVCNPSNVAAAPDDSAAIQNALNACPGNGTAGGTPWCSDMLVPAGWYKVTNTLIVNLSLVKLRGESARMSVLVMPLGIQNDILRSLGGQAAITNGTDGYEENIRIEDLGFFFATGTGFYGSETDHNTNNSAIVISNPDEGTTIKNIVTMGGGIGIRCFGGGGGAAAAFRDVVCSDAAIAGISIEPVPGKDHAGGHVLITGLTGDHRYDESRSTASLARFVNFVGVARIDDVNAEGAYGGGVIQHKFPEPSSGWTWIHQMGLLSVRNCVANFGSSFSGYSASSDFIVLKGGLRTASVTIENANIYGGHLIRDELTGRTVSPHDAVLGGLSQGACRIPTSYEAFTDGANYSRSRFVAGDKVLYTFAPTNTGWYRLMGAPCTGFKIGGKVSVTSIIESSEFSVDVLSTGGASAAQLSVTRATLDNGWSFPPCVTKVRAGAYQDGSGNDYPFVDVFVNRILTDPDPDNDTITFAYSLFDSYLLSGCASATPLLTPTTPLAGGNPVPSGCSGCSLVQCVTNSLSR